MHALAIADGFSIAEAIPLEADRALDSLDINTGFTWNHGGYEVKNKGMRATRQFNPPGNIW